MAKRRAKQQTKQQTKKKREPLFTAYNYQVLGIGLVMVFVGFLIMYLENEVNGFISLFISPLLILGGYGTVIYSIMTRKDKTNGGDQSSSTTGNPVAS